MPAPERGGGPSPERQKGRAVPPQPQNDEPSPWYRAARYETEPPSERAYFQAQETIFHSEADLSAYRLMLEQIYHVAVLGGAPAEVALQERIVSILYAEGTPMQLPEDVLTVLNERRQQAQQIGPWMEGHYRPGKVVEVKKKGKNRKR